MTLFGYLSNLDTHDRLVLALVFGLLALFLASAALNVWLMHCRDRDERTDEQMRRGMREAWRRGLLKDADQ